MPRKGGSGPPLVGATAFDAARAAMRSADDLVETDKRRIAQGQARRQWGDNPKRNLRPFLDEPAEQEQVAMFLNGSFAAWVERATLCRWVRLDPAEMGSISTVAQYALLLYQHLTGKPQDPGHA